MNKIVINQFITVCVSLTITCHV